MMKQTERSLRQLSHRVRACSRATVAAVILAAPLMAMAAISHPVHGRPRVALRSTMVAQTESKPKTPAHAARPGAAKGGVAKAAPSANRNAKANSAKSGTHAKSRRGRPQEANDPEPVVMQRTRMGRGRSVAKPVLRSAAVSRPRAGAARPRQVATAAKIADASAPLTVDDFVRAAAPTSAPDTKVSAPDTKVYVRGESHTEEDERLATEQVAIQTPVRQPMALKPSATRRPVITASVDAGDGSDGMSAAFENPAPSDLVGAPVAPAASRSITPRNVRADTVMPRLPAPTREEVTDAVLQPVVLPGLYRNGRLVVPAPLKGTHDILVHQNTMADDEGLERIQDEDDLQRLRAAHLLVNFPESGSLHVNPELASDRRCARVWTVRFATNIARDFYARFHEPLQVNSAVRTVAYQVRLQRINGNAAGTDGETASPHLTGQAMDLGKRGMSVAQIAWMRAYLLPLMQAGKVDVEEEFQQACFHISVYRSYMPTAPAKRRVPRTEVAQLHEPRVVAKSAGRGDELR